MARVVGIGGIFFKAKDPEALRAWYRDRLGIEVLPWGGAAMSWNSPDSPGEKGVTIWSVFEDGSDYFGSERQRFMVNYIVADLAALLADLRSEGCDVDSKTDESEFGKFGWVTDPEGNRVELWEPPK